MEPRKLTKVDIDKVRNIDGFPIGTDDDIIALSDAPYYTACPNPFIEEFIRKNGTAYDEPTDDYHREPFAADISEGKKDPVYNAHSYHTKVPYKAIMRYILHYTKPGDIVFDGFCGTGMTGLAAQMCGAEDQNLKQGLLYPDKDATWGSRKAIVSDLSPVATYIAALYNNSVNVHEYTKYFRIVFEKTMNEYAWMYNTTLPETTQTLIGNESNVHVDYTVYSDVFICPNCSKEIVFFDVAVKEDGSILSDFTCPHCGAITNKRSVARAKMLYFDPVIKETVESSKQIPVLISYTYNGRQYEKKPTQYDYKLIEKIESEPIRYNVLVVAFPEGDKTGEPRRLGINFTHQLFFKRSLLVISSLWHHIEELQVSNEMKIALKATVTGVMPGVSKMQRYRMNSTFPNMILSGTLYIGSLTREWNVLDWVQGKFKSLVKMKQKISHFKPADVVISTNSLTNTTIPDSSIDYIFTDPPFGSNLMYSELNLLLESWFGVLTNNKTEAIMNLTQKKNLLDYQNLMTKSFSECYRVLKPNRWMTVEFHNSKNSIWNAIQEALNRSGFIVADVRILDKKQSSFNQLKGAAQAIKQDLVISAYKPTNSFANAFSVEAGSIETAFSFVRQHLSKVPVVVNKEGTIEIIAERQSFMLWDRMVAYHIVNGMPVPLDATDFYKGLNERFLNRDNMYFLPDQINEYDMVRSTCEVETIQFSLFVSDEKSAIGWLYQQLDEQSGDGPQTYQDLMPKFMQELKAVDKREKMPELSVILEENFLKNEDGKWYIPDLTKSGDIAKLREKNLLKEFQEYLSTKSKLKVFRSEAVRAGFAKLWKDKDYSTIVTIAERLPDETIQEDSTLLMYYDISLSRI